MNLLLWLTPEGLRAWQQPTRPPAFFAADAEGLSAFATYLATTDASRWRLLLDLPGEEFVTLPPPPAQLAFFDRYALRQRYLAEQFPERTLRAAIAEPRPQRGDNLTLLAHDDAAIAPWLEALEPYRERADGIHALGVLAVAAAGLPPRFSGIVQILGDVWLRQIVVRQGRPCFSRQISCPERQAVATWLGDETRRLLQHLHRLEPQADFHAGLMLLPPTLSLQSLPGLNSETGLTWSLRTCSPAQWQQDLLAELGAGRRQRLSADLSPPAFRRAARWRRGVDFGLRLSSLLFTLSLAAYLQAHAEFSLADETASSHRHSSIPATALPALLNASGERLLAEMLEHQASSARALAALTAWSSLPASCHQTLPVNELRWQQRELQLQVPHGTAAAQTSHCQPHLHNEHAVNTASRERQSPQSPNPPSLRFVDERNQ